MNPFSMEPDQMRALGYRAVDALVDRWSTLPETQPWQGATRTALEGDALFLAQPPETPSDPMAVMELALSRILPVAARVDHPDFLAYIPSAPTWPSVMGDLLATGFNIFQGTWQGGAAPARIELQVLEWFCQWMGLPASASGVFTSGGSAANALAVVVARDRALAANDRPGGRAGRPRLLMYLSDQGHTSLIRGAHVAGIPSEDIRILPTGPDYRLTPQAVRAAVEADLTEDPAAIPFLLAANAAATNTGIVDPLDGLLTVARSLGLHFHVDAAYGGFGILDPRGTDALKGIEGADTITLDPHKWLFQPFECGCLLARAPESLHRSFSMAGAAYLHDTDLGQSHVNFGERGIQLTRSFRALKVWMSLQTYGLGTFRQAIGQGIDLAEVAEARLRSSPRLEVLTPATMGIVTWRIRPSVVGGVHHIEEAHGALQAHLTSTGTAFLSSTVLREGHALRFCFLNPGASEARLTTILAAIEDFVGQWRPGQAE